MKLLRSAGALYTTYYQIDDYVDYYYGSLLTNTSKIYLFGLEKYFDGLLLRIPDLKNPGVLPEMTHQTRCLRYSKSTTAGRRSWACAPWATSTRW